MDADIEWFPSKVDSWLAAILIVAPMVSASGFLAPGVWEDPTVLAIAIAGPGLILALYGLLVFPMRYGIGREQLVIRHGVVRQRVALREILIVEPSSSPLSSPALSLDRLRVSKGERWNDSVLISPVDRERFLALLAERGGLVREADRLLRR